MTLRKALRGIGVALLWLVIALCVTSAAVPPFLDRVYYRGEQSDHFDGERFANPGQDDTATPPTGGSRAGFFARFLRPDDRPAWPASVAVAKDVPPARVAGDAMRVTWVGHASVLVQADGLNILTDPIWSDIAGPFGLAGPRRVSPPGIDFDRLPKIDLIVVSHNHYDHLDLATLKRLWDRDRPAIVTSLGNDAILRSAGIEATALDWGRVATLTGTGLQVEDGPPRCDPDAACPGDRAQVAVTRNHHWSSRWFVDRNRALWSSFVVKLPGGNLFFAGDTGAGDMKWADEAVAHGPIRLAILPIGAFRFYEGQMRTASHVGPGEALEIWRRLGRPFALPIHWGTFRLSWEGHDTPPNMLRAIQTCAGEDAARFARHEIGLPFNVPAIGDATAAVKPGRPIAECLKTPAVTRFR
jgi:L-ascorbate metabolism protein UlaG (beta-lactamase superfamily)